MSQAQNAAYMAEVEEKIAARGVCIQGVFEDERKDCYCYTVGLVDELVIVGLRPEQGAGVLNVAVDRLRLSPDPMRHNDIRGDVIANARVKFIACATDLPQFPLTVARVRRGGQPFRAFQLQWPDEHGRLPGEDGYDSLRFPQAWLGAPIGSEGRATKDYPV